MLVTDHDVMQASTLDAADILGADISKLKSSGNVDWFRVAKDFLFMRVTSVGGNVTDSARRIEGVDNVDSWLPIFINGDGTFGFGTKEVLDGASHIDSTSGHKAFLEFCISQMGLLASKSACFPVSSDAAVEGSDAATHSFVLTDGSTFTTVSKHTEMIGHEKFLAEANGDFTFQGRHAKEIDSSWAECWQVSWTGPLSRTWGPWWSWCWGWFSLPLLLTDCVSDSCPEGRRLRGACRGC
jgi:hypothetical protein